MPIATTPTTPSKNLFILLSPAFSSLRLMLKRFASPETAKRSDFEANHNGIRNKSRLRNATLQGEVGCPEVNEL
jgi:hypothetical protein